MKKIILHVIAVIALIIAGWCLNVLHQNSSIEPTIIDPVIPKPLEKYTIENLSNTLFEKGEIILGDIIEEEDNYTSYFFSFSFKPNPTSKNTKTTTGQINIPNGDGTFPVIVMFRGYVDQEIYTTGIGTRKSAAVYADNGYITIAPDFLGYAGSDEETDDIFEARFQTYTTALSLLNSLDSIAGWDQDNVFIWGHSNGGQIAITVLEITGADYPTVLWAPVTKPFPYSILYYTDESEDRGKFIRNELAKFEDLYDVDDYSLDDYLDKISAPIQIHQGTADDAVPYEWSNNFVEKLEDLEKEVDYYIYPGADHNLVPYWDTVVNRNITFFNSFPKQ